jgi:type III secretory pathway lipoprotein EscJ
MRSSSQSSPLSALGRLRPWFEKVRRSVLAQRPTIRWGVGAAAIALCLVLYYLASSTSTTAADSYLRSGQRFSSDDLKKIGRALDRQRIGYRVDDQRRVAVAADQFDAAASAISKLELGPRALDEIRDQSAASSVWESVRDREVREHQRQEKILESMINELDGVVGSFVWINRPKERLGSRDAARPSAFVRLETEGDRQLPFRAIQAITTNLTGAVPGLAAEAITVVDRRGHKYLDAGNPALSALSHSRAREEELSQEILEKLDWIKGVRVSVQVPGGGMTGSGSTANPDPDSSGETTGSSSPGTGHGPAESSRTSPPLTPAVAINRPLSLEPEPAAGAESPAPAPVAPGRGRVWVKVPRSYYYNVSILPSRKEPTIEELQKLVARTEEQIRTGIAHVVPLTGPAGWEARVDVITDEVPLGRPPVVGSAPDSRRLALDWGIAGGMGALAAAAVTVGSWVLGARRPARRPESSSSVRYHRGAAAMPGPSERVREFVRRNPESAVSVLERWTSQGADPS